VCFVLIPSFHYLTYRDPQVQVDIVDALYDGGPFLTSLPKGLREDGILIAQVGEAARMEAPAEERSWHRNRVKFIKTLIENGFESIRDYEEVRIDKSRGECDDMISNFLPYLFNFRAMLASIIHGSLLLRSRISNQELDGFLTKLWPTLKFTKDCFHPTMVRLR
jgi:hypothetical protein